MLTTPPVFIEHCIQSVHDKEYTRLWTGIRGIFATNKNILWIKQKIDVYWSKCIKRVRVPSDFYHISKVRSWQLKHFSRGAKKWKLSKERGKTVSGLKGSGKWNLKVQKYTSNFSSGCWPELLGPRYCHIEKLQFCLRTWRFNLQVWILMNVNVLLPHIYDELRNMFDVSLRTLRKAFLHINIVVLWCIYLKTIILLKKSLLPNIFSVLLLNWRYFFKAQPIIKVNGKYNRKNAFRCIYKGIWAQTFPLNSWS